MYFFTLGATKLSVCKCPERLALYTMNIMQLGNFFFMLGAKVPSDRTGDNNNYETESVLYRFNSQSGAWITLAKPPFPSRVVGTSAIHEGFIYVIGGASMTSEHTIPHSSVHKSCFAYNIRQNTWGQIADYPFPVSHPAACSVQWTETVYPRAESEDLSDSDLDHSDKEESKANQSGDGKPKEVESRLEHKSRLFVIGGGGSWEFLERDQCYSYDPVTNHWSPQDELNQGRAGHRVCFLDGKIYALAGRDPDRMGTKIVESYTPETDRWTVLKNAPLNSIAASPALLIHDNHITIMGGGDDDNKLIQIIQTLDVEKQKWHTYTWKDTHPKMVVHGAIQNMIQMRFRQNAFSDPSPPNPDEFKNALFDQVENVTVDPALSYLTQHDEVNEVEEGVEDVVVDNEWGNPGAMDNEWGNPGAMDNEWGNPGAVDNDWGNPGAVDEWGNPGAVNNDWGNPGVVNNDWADIADQDMNENANDRDHQDDDMGQEHESEDENFSVRL